MSSRESEGGVARPPGETTRGSCLGCFGSRRCLAQTATRGPDQNRAAENNRPHVGVGADRPKSSNQWHYWLIACRCPCRVVSWHTYWYSRCSTHCPDLTCLALAQNAALAQFAARGPDPNRAAENNCSHSRCWHRCSTHRPDLPCFALAQNTALAQVTARGPNPNRAALPS